MNRGTMPAAAALAFIAVGLVLAGCGPVNPTGTWRAGSQAPAPQPVGATLALLPDGRALFSGGNDQVNPPMQVAELYDPAHDAWSFAPSMWHGHSGAAAVSLANGDVLIVGGSDASGPTDAADLYVASRNLWVDAGHSHVPPEGAAAVALRDGRVLFTGGAANPANISDVQASTEIYDPTTNRWHAGPSMRTARAFHTAVLLADGRVLVAGGSAAQQSLRNAEIYDPTANRWAQAPAMLADRTSAVAVRLKDGRVMIMGGGSGGPGGYQPTQTVQIYDPGHHSWGYGPDMLPNVFGDPLLLPDGRVLIIGMVPGSPSATTLGGELFDPHTDAWRPLATGPTMAGFAQERAVAMPNGRVLVMLGNHPYVFDPNGVPPSPRTKPEQPLGSLTTTEALGTIAAVLLLLVVGQYLWVRRQERRAGPVPG